MLLDLIGAITPGTPKVFLPLYISLRYTATYNFAGTAGNTASTLRPGYCEFALPASTQFMVVFDFASNIYRAYTYPNFADAALTNYVIVFMSYNSGYDCLWNVHEGELPALLLNYTLALDGSTLYVPPISYLAEDGTSQTYSNSDGSLYTEVTLPGDAVSGAYAMHVYYDSALRALGSNPLVAVSAAASGAMFAAPGTQTIARIWHGQIESPIPVANMVRNEFASNILAPIRNAGTSQVSITDAALTGLFSTGYTNSGTTVFVGGFVENRRSTGYGFARVYLQAPSAGVFGTPQCYWQDQNGNATLVGNMVLEKVLSTTARIYSLKFALSPTGVLSPHALTVGTYVLSGTCPTICGMQFGFGDNPNIWISRSDYPYIGRPSAGLASLLYYALDASVDLLPASVFLIRGRTTTLHPNNLSPSATEGERFTAGIVLYSADSDPVVMREQPLAWDIVPAASYTSGSIVKRDRFLEGDRRFWKSFVAHTAPARFPTTPPTTRNVLFISDSKLNYQTVSMVAAKLGQIGVTPTFIGTVNTSSTISSATDASGPLGECRPGWSWANYANIDTVNWGTAGGTISVVSNWATYLAAAKATKVNYNPFINGSSFDFSNYLTQTGQATPNDVVLALGANDAVHYAGSLGLTQIMSALPTIYASIRAKSASIRIGICLEPFARSISGDIYWENNLAPYIAYFLQFVATKVAGGDSNVFVIPTWLAYSRDAGWKMDGSISVNGYTGTQTGIVTDYIHSDLPNLNACAEMLTAFIACGAAGV